MTRVTPDPIVERSISPATTRRHPASTTSTGSSVSDPGRGDARLPYVSANLYAGLPRLAALSAAPHRPAAGRAHRHQRPDDAGTMLWRREQLGSRVRVGADPPAARPRSGTCAGMPMSPWSSPIGLGGRASYDTSGVGDENVVATLATMWFRPDIVVVGHSQREIRDSIIGGVHFVQPRHRRASRWCIWTSSAATGAGGVRRAPAGLVSTRNVPPRRCSRAASRRRGIRSGPRPGRRSDGGRADARERRAGSSRIAILDFVQDVQRRRSGAELVGRVGVRPAGGVRRRHRSAWPTCSRCIRSTTRFGRCG